MKLFLNCVILSYCHFLGRVAPVMKKKHISGITLRIQFNCYLEFRKCMLTSTKLFRRKLKVHAEYDNV